MNTLRKALNTVGDTLSQKTSASSSSTAGSLSGCTVTVAQRKVKVGDKVRGAAGRERAGQKQPRCMTRCKVHTVVFAGV